MLSVDPLSEIYCAILVVSVNGWLFQTSVWEGSEKQRLYLEEDLNVLDRLNKTWEGFSISRKAFKVKDSFSTWKNEHKSAWKYLDLKLKVVLKIFHWNIWIVFESVSLYLT